MNEYNYIPGERAPRNVTDIIFPSTVKIIGNSDFMDCRSLSSVTIPSSVTEISAWAFYNCSSLTTVTIPTSITKIGSAAFGFCRSLLTINIPPSVTTIGNAAFNGCSSLTSISIPSSVTKISNYAFFGCSALTCISIPSSVTEIGFSTFEHCHLLSSVTIPSSVTAIRRWAFRTCISLTAIVIPESVTDLSASAFENCPSLESIVLWDVPCLAIRNERFGQHPVINEKLATLCHVLHNPSNNKHVYFRSHVQMKLKEISGLCIIPTPNCDEFEFAVGLYVNWNVCAKTKNVHQNGRLPLFTAVEENLALSEGLCDVLKGNPAAIENVDPVTGLEAFMLAAVGPKSRFESVYKLLEDHPAAIIPYVKVSSAEQSVSSRKRKCTFYDS